MTINSLVDKYCETIDEFYCIACKCFGIESKNEFIKLRLTSQSHNFEYEEKKCNIFFHGRGCKIQVENSEIDWDFGYDDFLYGLNPYHIKFF